MSWKFVFKIKSPLLFSFFSIFIALSFILLYLEIIFRFPSELMSLIFVQIIKLCLLKIIYDWLIFWWRCWQVFAFLVLTQNGTKTFLFIHFHSSGIISVKTPYSLIFFLLIGFSGNLYNVYIWIISICFNMTVGWTQVD